jgi:hypothetical protein
MQATRFSEPNKKNQPARESAFFWQKHNIVILELFEPGQGGKRVHPDELT